MQLTGCPDGYTYHAGDAGGWGTLSDGRGTIIKDTATCAEQCDGAPACCSFEYSPTSKICNLNVECTPSKGVFEDYVFCVKGNLIVNYLMFEEVLTAQSYENIAKIAKLP